MYLQDDVVVILWGSVFTEESELNDVEDPEDPDEVSVSKTSVFWLSDENLDLLA